uniref:CS domain-containing protein n=2 Tax=Auxenochlorella protothecoides TaxID=3075 RepID=A0A1D1ZP65_AUXPR
MVRAVSDAVESGTGSKVPCNSMSASLRQLKAEHLKKRGDAALKDGNLREACAKYDEAIDLQPSSSVMRALLSNRALAHTKARRFEKALEDAEAAVALAPSWDKGYWRKGVALEGLHRIADAVQAFLRVWTINGGDSESTARLQAVVRKLTREQLGSGMLVLIEAAVQEGAIPKATVECVPVDALHEAAFLVVKQAHHGVPSPGPYYARYLSWLTSGISPPAALIERSRIHAAGRCFLQAAADAEHGVRLLFKADIHGIELAQAYACQGAGYLAVQGHADRAPAPAAACFLKALDNDQGLLSVQASLEEAVKDLTKEEYDQVRAEVFNTGSRADGGLCHPEALGFVDGVSKAARARLYRVDIQLAFPEASTKALTAGVRQALRAALASAAGLELRRVTLDRVSNPRPDSPYLGVRLEAAVGGNEEAAYQILRLVEGTPAAQEAALESVLSAVSSLGPVDHGASSADVVDITPRGVQPLDAGGPDSAGPLVPATPPKMELEVPYRMYRITRIDGSTVDRVDKHPFCMSRVYYDAAEKPEELWAELADGSCRWRQTGAEVKVCVLKVPHTLRPRQLSVTLEPYSIKVSNKDTGEVYLEGTLERGIVPEDSVWTHGGGSGEDGTMLYLQKMNLELLQKHWMHSEMWWPRLLRHHSEIAWDDYEKDYSDLPEQVLQHHRICEAQKDQERTLEALEKSKREMLQERDDLRRRQRQERLHYLRTGVRKSWVELNRANPG